MDFFEKVKGFLTKPSKTFDASKEETLNEAIKYYAIVAVISAFSIMLFLAYAYYFGPVMGYRGMPLGAGGGIITAALSSGLAAIPMIIGAFITGAILHIFVYIVGGRKGIVQTIKAVMYGSTPGLLLAWLSPAILPIPMIWPLVLTILGIRQLHELTTGRAIVAVLIPMITAFILIIVLVQNGRSY